MENKTFSIKFLVLLFSTIISVNLLTRATETIHYVYDASGNRIEREILLGLTKSATVKDTDTVAQPTYTDAIGDLNIHIYPNPTQGLLNVKMNNLPENQSAQIQVLDINGRLVYDKATEGTTSVDLSAQPTGTYILRFIFNGQTSTWKVLKQ